MPLYAPTRRSTYVVAALAVTNCSVTPHRSSRAASVGAGNLAELARRPLVVMGAGGPYWRPCTGEPDPAVEGTEGRFALYDDGLVIFTHTTGDSCLDMEGHLTPQAAREFADSIMVAGFRRLMPDQEVTHATDQPGVGIIARDGDTWYRAQVTGLNRFGRITSSEGEDPDPTFMIVLRAIARFDVPGAVPWVPHSFGVRLVPARYCAPGANVRGVPWPSDLPRPPQVPELYPAMALVDRSLLGRVRALASPAGGTYVAIEGRTWCLGVFDDPLPEQPYIDEIADAFERLRDASR
jgi:hypothetical protein